MRYKLIDNNFKKTESSEFSLLFLIPLGTCAITVLLSLILNSGWSLIAIIPIPLSLIFRNQIRTWFPDWINASNIIGTISFNHTSIITNTYSEYQTKNIKAIKIHHNHIQGQMMSNRDILHNGVSTIEIEFLNEQKALIKLLVESTKQQKSLIHTIKLWYKEGIIIKETFGNYYLKTLLLKPNRDFNEIQKIKKELNIQSIY